MHITQLPHRTKAPLDEIHSLPSIECGEEARQYFNFAPGYRNLNHGSFGTYPTPIREVLHYYQDASEARPDKFIRYEYPSLLDKSRAALAQLLKVNVNEVVILSNATSGINTVLRGLVFDEGDVIIYFSSIYGACEKTVDYITETTPAESRCIDLVYPCSHDAICDNFLKTIKTIEAEGKKARVAIFDTIVSLPGVRCPFERLTKLCAEHDVLSCIDGAHSVGQIELDLGESKPDFFVSNAHKWLHVPRACAVFYVPLRNQPLIRSTIPTSHGFIPRPRTDGKAINNPLPPNTNSAFVANFEFVGTMDNSPYLCVPAAVEWRAKLTWNGLAGEAAVYGYTQHLAVEAGKIFASTLGTEVMESEEKTLTKCSMSNVRLPLVYMELTGGDAGKVAEITRWMVKTLVDEYETFIAVIFHNNAWWVRLSGQVYLTKEDFEYGAKTMKEVCERVKKGEWQKA